MREAIGGTWLFGIVVVFIVLFSGYLAMSVNYSKAFKVKNAIVDILEKEEGHSDAAKDKIKEYNKNVGYGVSSNCETGYTGADPVSSAAGSNVKYRYCIKCESNNSVDGSRLPTSYYSIKVFFKLDLPVIGNMFVFPISGETKPIRSACKGV